VTYSYTQISQYLSCPRRYKHRYLDGWKETDTRAAMIFGRVFELAIAAYFQQEDAAAVLYREWAAHRESRLYYSQRDSWDRMLRLEFSCSSALPRTIGFALGNLAAICRSNS